MVALRPAWIDFLLEMTVLMVVNGKHRVYTILPHMFSKKYACTHTLAHTPIHIIASQQNRMHELWYLIRPIESKQNNKTINPTKFIGVYDSNNKYPTKNLSIFVFLVWFCALYTGHFELLNSLAHYLWFGFCSCRATVFCLYTLQWQKVQFDWIYTCS